MDLLFKKVFNNKFLNNLIWKFVQMYNGYKYEEITLLTWMITNGYFGLALDKLKFNKDQLPERFGVLNLYELVSQMDIISASELFKYLLTEYDFGCSVSSSSSSSSSSINEISKKRNKYFSSFPILDLITKTCNLNDIKLLESVIPSNDLLQVTSTLALDNAALNPSIENRHSIIKYLLSNRIEGCTFRILINLVESNDLELLKYLIENVNKFNKPPPPPSSSTSSSINQIILDNQDKVIKNSILNLNIELLKFILVEFSKIGFNFQKINWFEMIYSLLESSTKQQQQYDDKVLEIIKFIVENLIDGNDDNNNNYQISKKIRESLLNNINFQESLMNSFIFCINNSFIEILEYLLNQSKLIKLPLDKHVFSNCYQFTYLYSISFKSLVFCNENNINLYEYKSNLVLNEIDAINYSNKFKNLKNKFEIINTNSIEFLKSLFENNENYHDDDDDDLISSIDIDSILIESAANGNLSILEYIYNKGSFQSYFTDELVQVALKENKLSVIKLLYKFGIEIDMDKLLMVASALNNSDAIIMIFKDLKFDKKNITSNHLEASCKRNCLSTLQYLYENCEKSSNNGNPNLSIKNKQLFSILTLNNCILHKDWNIVNWLLDNIFTIPRSDSTNTTTPPLEQRIIDQGIKNLKIVKKLILHGFKFSKQSYNRSVENLDVLKYLDQTFASKQECTTDAIDNASLHDCYNSVKYLLDNRNEGYRLAIQYSLTRGWFDIINLITYGDGGYGANDNDNNEDDTNDTTIVSKRYKQLFKPQYALKSPLYNHLLSNVILLNSPMILQFIIDINKPTMSITVTGELITDSIVKSGNLTIFKLLLNQLNYKLDNSILIQCLNISKIYDRPQIENYLNNLLK